MSLKRSFGVHCQLTPWLGTLKCRQTLMIFADVLAQCLFLSEALPTILTAKPLLALVDGLMPFKSSTCDETLAAAFLWTDMFPLKCMDCFDVLFQMLVLDIVLVTIIIRAFEWTGIGMRIEMVP
jgi:hypothetical protein